LAQLLLGAWGNTTKTGGTEMNVKKTVAIAGALTALALPAFAETSLYGSARVASFWNVTDTAGNKEGDIDEHLQGNSTFGANFVNGAITGKVEFGAGTGAVGTRLLYGTWNFGEGKLTVGQDYNSYYLGSAQVHTDDNASKAYGALWENRQAQIRVNLNNGLYFAAIQPSTGLTATGAPSYTTSNTQTTGHEIYLPKLNVGYAGKTGSIGYNFGVVGQTFKNEAVNKQVTSVLGYAQGTAAFGATSLQGSASFAQNAGNMGFMGRAVYDTAAKKDVTGFEGYLQASQKVSETVSANIGFGYTYDQSSASGAKADDKMLFFVNAPVTLTKNAFVVPEFSYYDQLKKAGVDEKNKLYAVGAKWQINF
jgi:hypothetical protein